MASQFTKTVQWKYFRIIEQTIKLNLTWRAEDEEKNKKDYGVRIPAKKP